MVVARQVHGQARVLVGVGEAVLQDMVAALPLRRPALPEEIADTVLYLASPRASYVSGAIPSVDGATAAMVV